MSRFLIVITRPGSGGRRFAWLFFAPTVLIAIYVFAQVCVWPSAIAAWDESALVVAILVCCFALWYFVIGRAPNFSMVRNVHRQVPSAIAVYGADAYARARDAGGFTASRANVLCITRTGLQLWAGRGDNARPISFTKWSDIDSVGPTGSKWSSAVAVTIANDSAVLMMSVLSNRVFSLSRVRGHARTKLVAQLDALRDPVSPPPKVV